MIIIDRFKHLREKLNDSIEKYGLNSDKTNKISLRFDKLINSYYKKEVQYSHESTIYKKYIESINALEKITQDFAEFPSIPEWNKYAEEKGLLSSESIKYISGLNWHDLRNRTLSKKN